MSAHDDHMRRQIAAAQFQVAARQAAEQREAATLAAKRQAEAEAWQQRVRDVTASYRAAEREIAKIRQAVRAKFRRSEAMTFSGLLFGFYAECAADKAKRHTRHRLVQIAGDCYLYVDNRGVFFYTHSPAGHTYHDYSEYESEHIVELHFPPIFDQHTSGSYALCAKAILTNLPLIYATLQIEW